MRPGKAPGVRTVERSCDHHDTRNDLLFTMSDITRLVRSPMRQEPHESIVRRNANFMCLDEPPGWWSQTGSNRRPPACKAGALPAELWPRTHRVGIKSSRRATSRPCKRRLVGLGRFELPTSRLSSARSNQLSYKPVILTTGCFVAPCDPARAQFKAHRHRTRRMTARGSSMKKEKRRRRRPANGAHD